MRHYDCYFKRYKNKKFVATDNNACWGGISDETVKFIYIYRFHDATTVRYQKLLISIINKITPCKIITINNKRYIKYKFLGEYSQDLILLSFIRNLWHEPYSTPNYASNFFEALKASKEKDPLKRLLLANKVACPANLPYSPGHSNVHNKLLLKIKSKKDFMNTTTTQDNFLTW